MTDNNVAQSPKPSVCHLRINKWENSEKCAETDKQTGNIAFKLTGADKVYFPVIYRSNDSMFILRCPHINTNHSHPIKEKL